LKTSQFTSEYIGHSIRGADLFTAWFNTLQYVFKYGIDNTKGKIEYHSIHWNYPVNSYGEFEQPIAKWQSVITQENVQKMIGLNSQMLCEYAKTITRPSVDQTVEYTYGDRIELFKHQMILELLKDKNTRYANGTTILTGHVDRQPPCLVYLQLLYDQLNNKLNMYVTFRSHDLFKASFMNAYGLGILLLEIGHVTSIPVGRVEITSISAHIYQEDLNNVSHLINCIGQSNMFKEILTEDMRGNVFIEKLPDNKFKFVMRSPYDRTIVAMFEGTNKEVYQAILKNKIVVDTEHLEWIFNELF
jgi:hypothetical protein